MFPLQRSLNSLKYFFVDIGRKWNHRRNKPQPNKFSSVIGVGMTVGGPIGCAESQTVRIDGKLVSGSLSIAGDKSTIVVGPRGSVTSTDVENALVADHIIIDGSVIAKSIHARETLYIGPLAKLTVTNIIYGGTLEVKTGAMITGYFRDGDPI